jgi:hypothetical protein
MFINVVFIGKSGYVLVLREWYFESYNNSIEEYST